MRRHPRTWKKNYVFLLTIFCFLCGELDEFLDEEDDDDELEDPELDESESKELDESDDDEEEDDDAFFLLEIPVDFVCLERGGGE